MARLSVSPNKVPMIAKNFNLPFEHWHGQKLTSSEIVQNNQVIGYEIVKAAKYPNGEIKILDNHLPCLVMNIPVGTYQMFFPFPGKIRLMKKPTGFQGPNVYIVR